MTTTTSQPQSKGDWMHSTQRQTEIPQQIPRGTSVLRRSKSGRAQAVKNNSTPRICCTDTYEKNNIKLSMITMQGHHRYIWMQQTWPTTETDQKRTGRPKHVRYDETSYAITIADAR